LSADAETRHGGGTKITKITKITKTWMVFFVDFAIFVIFVAAAVGPSQSSHAARLS
jgi:hypothetical protein